MKPCKKRVITSSPVLVDVQNTTINISVCLSCLPVQSYTTSKATCPNFTKFSTHVNYAHGSIQQLNPTTMQHIMYCWYG